MTTNTTNSPDIHDLLCDLFEAGYESPGKYDCTPAYKKARDAILAHIKAKVALVQSDADLRYKELAELHERTLDKLQEPEHNAWRKACKEIIDQCVAPDMQSNAMEMLTRAYNEAGHTQPQIRIRELTGRLAEIQRGVEGMSGWEPIMSDFEPVMGNYVDGDYLKRADVLALLQPQGQADTSKGPVRNMEVTPELLRHLQLNTELGAHACADLAGGYSLIKEIIEAAFKFRQPPQSDTSGLPG